MLKKQVMSKKLEGVVIEQSKLLKELMPSLLKHYKGKFVAFLDGNTIIGDSHAECYTKASKQWGADSGFVIDEISSQVAMVSALVKLM
jgi:hypothetical protein